MAKGTQLEAFPNVGGAPSRLIEKLEKQRDQLKIMQEKCDLTEGAVIESLEKLGKTRVWAKGKLITVTTTTPKKHVRITQPKEDSGG